MSWLEDIVGIVLDLWNPTFPRGGSFGIALTLLAVLFGVVMVVVLTTI